MRQPSAKPLSRRPLWFLATALVVLIVYWTGARIHTFVRVDRCLDGGGRWLAESQSCELAP